MHTVLCLCAARCDVPLIVALAGRSLTNRSRAGSSCLKRFLHIRATALPHDRLLGEPMKMRQHAPVDRFVAILVCVEERGAELALISVAACDWYSSPPSLICSAIHSATK